MSHLVIQDDLFAVRHTRLSDPDTSWDAAKSMRQAANAQCAKVLGALRELGVAGAEEIAPKVGMLAHAVRRRLPDLQKAGLAAPTDMTRKTASGRSERYWRAT